MFTILLHSSKTMREGKTVSTAVQSPVLISHAIELARYLQSLTTVQIQLAMKLSPAMASKTATLVKDWGPQNAISTPAIDAFIGDIYSGLQVDSFDSDDRAYANEHLFILSGLYGVVRALDNIQPYRLEMGYRLPDLPFTNLYTYWGDRIASALPADRTIINLSAVEYTKAVFPYLSDAHIIMPTFLTVSPKSGEPTFVTVHAKIARGAFAHWLIKNRIQDESQLHEFNELNYLFDATLSTDNQPVFVCKEFGGIGMSIRLQ